MSGIGCSSRIPGYTTAYGFNSVHGRALPIAQGIKLANPDLLVLVAGGDGDGFSIGGGHVAHAIRRNIDLTYIVMDNQIYGLTKGQLSPTSPEGLKTASSSYGSMEDPVNPLLYVLGYGARFVAQGTPADMAGLAQVIEEGIRFPGFAFINVQSPCVTYGEPDQQLKAQKTQDGPLAAPGARSSQPAPRDGAGPGLRHDALHRGVLPRPAPDPTFEALTHERQAAMREQAFPREGILSSSSRRSSSSSRTRYPGGFRSCDGGRGLARRQSRRRLARSERGRRRHLGRHHPRELAALEQFPSSTAAPRDLVPAGAHRLLRAAAGLHGQRLAVARGRDEPEHPVVSSPSLTRMTPLPGPDRKLISSTGHSIARACRVAAITVSPPRTRPRRRPRRPRPACAIAPARARARLDKRLEPEPQAVAVAGHGQRVDAAARRPPRAPRAVRTTRGSRLKAATTRSPSRNLNSRCIGLPVTGRGGHVDDAAGVGDAEIGEEHDRARVLPAWAASTRIAFAQPRGGRDPSPPSAASPSRPATR